MFFNIKEINRSIRRKMVEIYDEIKITNLRKQFDREIFGKNSSLNI